MNQQREVIYSLRAFALEGGEELKGEALKMVEKAVGASRRDRARRVRGRLEEWDFDLLRQELLMHYLLQVPEFDEENRARPTDLARRADAARSRRAGAAFAGEDRGARHGARPGGRLRRPPAALVMLNVLDEKWKDHLYDLDQLRNAIHYRSWGQKDPLLEYKQEAYTMFVDLMNDVARRSPSASSRCSS